MNREYLAKLYEKANGWSPAPFQITMEELERFAALVLANNPPQSSVSWQEGCEFGRMAEREACAKTAEAWPFSTPKQIASAIRARSTA